MAIKIRLQPRQNNYNSIMICFKIISKLALKFVAEISKGFKLRYIIVIVFVNICLSSRMNVCSP